MLSKSRLTRLPAPQRWSVGVVAGQGLLLVSLSSGLVWAQGQAPAKNSSQGIYTCVDAQGRTLTSDRPIPECRDRDQTLLNPSGSVKARLGPTLTAHERAALEAKEKMAQDERDRLNEEKRRNRALLVRYPNQAVHDRERATALAQIGAVRQAAVVRVKELERQHQAILEEMAFYAKDPTKAPLLVRLEVEEVEQSLAIQRRFIADQDRELQRVNTRFDEELQRLKQLWSQQRVQPSF